LDGDRRRQSFDGIDIRLFHEAKKLASVRRERFYVAALSLGVDRIERQRRLSRTRQPRDDGKLVAWNPDVDVFEVVFPGTPDEQRIFGHSLSKLEARGGRFKP